MKEKNIHWFYFIIINILWFMFGVILCVAIIDDMLEFRIPGTDKVFIRSDVVPKKDSAEH